MKAARQQAKRPAARGGKRPPARPAARRARAPHRGAAAFLLLLILLSAILLVGVVNARTVRVRYGEAKLKNLDYRLDGVKILYLSDLKMSSVTDAKNAVKLVKRLNELGPDLILLGGDLTGDGYLSGIKKLLGLADDEGLENEKRAALDNFLLGLDEIDVKYGVYAVAGDGDPALTAAESRRANFRFLNDEAALININGGILPVYGARTPQIDLSSTGIGAMLFLFHDPAIYKTAALKASERNSEADSYLFLSGHALGGQVKIGSFCLRYPEYNRDFGAKANEYGLYADGSGIRMLLSEGIGTEGLPIRLGTRPSAYLITLRRKV